MAMTVAELLDLISVSELVTEEYAYYFVLDCDTSENLFWIRTGCVPTRHFMKPGK